MSRLRWLLFVIIALFAFSACTLETATPAPAPGGSTGGETASVSRIIDGDTIDVILNGQETRIRYIGVNTPERGESCYQEATDANAALVSGQTVRLVRDVSETDRFGRLLRYVYVGDVFVNARLVETGYAESVHYPPDTANAAFFDQLENQARTANINCYATGIFND